MIEAEYVVQKQTNQEGQMFLSSPSGPAMLAGDRCFGGYRQESGLSWPPPGPLVGQKGTICDQSPSNCRTDELYSGYRDSLGVS